ncbi:MAG: hypothetical protein LUQ52_08250, partial [Methylococcaceae bacterium]|nr:hypothetical protein [Methylococcaceae bacterium]
MSSGFSIKQWCDDVSINNYCYTYPNKSSHLKLSGKHSALLHHAPLRTVHATFTAHGSSLYNPCLT